MFTCKPSYPSSPIVYKQIRKCGWYFLWHWWKIQTIQVPAHMVRPLTLTLPHKLNNRLCLSLLLVFFSSHFYIYLWACPPRLRKTCYVSNKLFIPASCLGSIISLDIQMKFWVERFIALLQGDHDKGKAIFQYTLINWHCDFYKRISFGFVS